MTKYIRGSLGLAWVNIWGHILFLPHSELMPWKSPWKAVVEGRHQRDQGCWGSLQGVSGLGIECVLRVAHEVAASRVFWWFLWRLALSSSRLTVAKSLTQISALAASQQAGNSPFLPQTQPACHLFLPPPRGCLPHGCADSPQGGCSPFCLLPSSCTRAVLEGSEELSRQGGPGLANEGRLSAKFLFP